MEGILGPIEREQRRLDRLRFIREQMYVATKRREPGGPVPLSAQEALDFIARNCQHLVLTISINERYSEDIRYRIDEWTPAVYQALVDVAVQVREPDLASC